MSSETKREPNHEPEFNPQSIAVLELARYPHWYQGSVRDLEDTDKVRGDLCLESIKEGNDNGYTMIVAEGESSPEFVQELERQQVLYIHRDTPGRAVARRRGFDEASRIPGIKGVIRTEPEKVDLVKNHIPQIMKPILSGDADIVIPARKQDLFASTYPGYMYTSESYANKKYNKLLHEFGILPEDQLFDAFFGPVAFKNDPQVLDLFMKEYHFTGEKTGIRKYAAPEEFSCAQSFPVLEALHSGMKVATVEIPFRYSATQKENEEIAARGFVGKRMEQKWGFLAELVHFMRYLRDPENLKTLIQK